MDRLNNAMNVKASEGLSGILKRALLAGVFIGTGAFLYSIMVSVTGPENIIRLLGALLFTVGLNLVVFLKAQLFTGNNLMIFSLFTKSLPVKSVLRNWSLVYLGNFIGAFIFAIICFNILSFFPVIEAKMASIATKKVEYSFNESFIKAIFCNFLVCSAIYFAIVFKSTIHKVIGVVIPITLFVFMGFEHSIANMFFIPAGLFSSQLNLAEISSLFLGNIIPVTLGNIVGGFVFSTLIFVFMKIKKN